MYGWYESYYGTSAGTVVPSEPGRDFVYYPEPENDFVFAVVGQMGLFLLILLVVVVVRRRRLALPPLPAALPAARHAAPPYVYRPFIFGRPRRPAPRGPSAMGGGFRRWGLSRRRRAAQAASPAEAGSAAAAASVAAGSAAAGRTPLMQHTEGEPAPGLRHPFGICAILSWKGDSRGDAHSGGGGRGVCAPSSGLLYRPWADLCAGKGRREALERLRERDYDAVLLDVLMPNLDGFAVCRAVREGSGVPILFLTALGEGMYSGVCPGGGRLCDQALLPGGAAGQNRGAYPPQPGRGAETLACGRSP